MSGTSPVTPTPAGDPSMEDILASIRRILSEDEPAGGTGATAAEASAAEDDVLSLDSSMMVEEPAPAVVAPAPVVVPVAVPVVVPVGAPVGAPVVAAPVAAKSALMAPETEAAVASSMGGLLRTLIAEREQVSVYRGGPTIEDMVREEVRPLLKQWIDTHMQALVERLVRAEIERVVGRGLS